MSKRQKHSIITPIILLLVVQFVAGFFSTPAWVFIAFVVLAVFWLVWVLWTVVAARRGEDEYLLSTIMLYIFFSGTRRSLNWPDWTTNVALIAMIPLVIWSIRYTVKTWNS